MTRNSPSKPSKAKRRSKTTGNKAPTEKKSKQCPICFKYFFSFLPRHMEQHSEDEKKPFSCDFPGCDYAAHQRSNLKNHLGVHTGETIPCLAPGCSFACVDRSYLIRHKKTEHNYVPRRRAKADQTAPFLSPSPPVDSDQQQQSEPQKPNKRGRPKGSGKRLKKGKARAMSPDLGLPHSPVRVQYKYPEVPTLSPPRPSLQPLSPSYNPGSLGVCGVSPAVPNPSSVSLPRIDDFESDFTSNLNMNTEYTSTPSSYLLEFSPSEVLARSPLHMDTGMGLEPGSGMRSEAYHAVSNGAPSMANGMFLNQGLAYGVRGSLSPDSSSESGSNVYMGMGASLDEGIGMGTGMGFGMGVDNSLSLSPVLPIPLQLPHGSIGERLSASLDPSSIEAPGFRFDSYHSYFLPAIGSDASQSHVAQPMGMEMGNVPTQHPYYEPAELYLPQDNNSHSLYDQTPGAGPSNWLTRGPFY